MPIVWLIQEYIHWHYTEGIHKLLKICGNFLWFTYHFFSLELLARTLLKPFRRVRIEYSRIMSIEEIAENLAVNLFMRVVGFFMRSVVLIVGAVVEIGIFLASIAVVVIWIFFPAVIIGLFSVAGILLLSAG